MMNSQLKGLTGLRFFAAFYVVMFHFFIPRGPAAVHNFIIHGFIAVTLFFVLSGFILTYSYIDDMGKMRGSKHNFWIARFARIYPVYILAFFMYAPYAWQSIVLSGNGQPRFYEFAWFATAAVTLLQSWSPTAVGIWNPPAWSLSTEAFFYLVFPFVAPLIVQLSIRRVALLGIVLWVLSLAAQIAYFIYNVEIGAFWQFNPVVRLPEFLLGIVLAKIWKTRAHGTFEKYSGYVAIATLLMLTVLLCFGIQKIWYFNGVLTPLMMLLIYALACGRGILVRLLATKLVVLLGEASYALYIIHWPLWLMVGSFVSRDREIFRQGPLLYYSIIAISASILIFKLVEQPFNRWIRKVFSSPQKLVLFSAAASE